MYLSNISKNIKVSNPQNDQAHSNNSSAVCRPIVWACLTILWGVALKGLKLWGHEVLCAITPENMKLSEMTWNGLIWTYPSRKTLDQRWKNKAIKKLRILWLKGQSCKLYNNKYRTASIQITNTEIFAFIAVLVFTLLSSNVLFINKQDNRNC